MEVAAVSVVSSKTWEKLQLKVLLCKPDVTLKTYTNEVMKVIGEAELNVTYGHDKHPLRLYVVEGNGPSLVGRDWLDSVLQKNEDVFVEDVSGFKAKLRVKANAVPRFLRARPIPFALKNAVGKELDRLETLGILRKVTHSAWASPIVVVPKKDGRLCSCGDFKVTVNAVLDVNKYPLPKPDDLFAALEGGLRFTKLNLRQAYQQLALEEGSQEFVTVNTHQGLYQFTRLPFGVASAPAIFQKIMDEILQGIPRVVCYLDDILISGSSDKEHLTNLEEVLKRLREAGIHLCKEKCVFWAESVEYLGHVCQVAKSAPPKAPLHPWVWPSKPWERIHVDFAGPFQRKTFFIVVDAHSKWPEVIPMSTTTSLATVVELTRLFASYGIPQQLMSDNGSQFTSQEFKKFLRTNGVRHILTASYHPSSNGAAERFVRTFKEAMHKNKGRSLHDQLMHFLLSLENVNV
ncbi:hypothetical protein EMCRGX_G002578 [Ephydatia muelleri]